MISLGYLLLHSFVGILLNMSTSYLGISYIDIAIMESQAMFYPFHPY